LAATAGIAAAAWKTTLRAVSLADGRIVWEQRLPAESDCWEITGRRGLFAVQGDVRRGFETERLLVLFHAIDGRPMQMLTQAVAANSGRWELDDTGVLFAGNGILSAWNAIAPSAANRP
jgi:hypothetical protein